MMDTMLSMRCVRILFCRMLAFVLLLSLLCAAAPAGFAEEAEVITAVIELNGSTASVTGSGAKAEGGIITIQLGGVYELRGTLDAGQVIVNTGETEGKVTLQLSGVSLTNSGDAAIVVERADKVKLVLMEGTENVLTSGTEKQLAACTDDSTGAAIYSSSDLSITGSGSLSVFGYINNGITCKKDLKIHCGVLNVTAANTGIKGTRSLQIKSGTLTVSAGNDGLKSTCTTREGKGWIEISGGQIEIKTAGDGISAATNLTVSGGQTVVHAGKMLYKAGAAVSIAPQTLSDGNNWQ